MASSTMTASFLSSTNFSKGCPKIAQRRLVVASAATGAEVESVKLSGEIKRECNSGRRELMFTAAAAAAAAVCAVAGIASAEPKPGTPEARKVYAPVCVTMPTAKICRK